MRSFQSSARAFSCALGVRPGSVQRKRLAQGFTFGLQFDPVAVMHDSVEYGVRQSRFTEVGVPCIHG
jgi:hypothetical protein